MSKHDKGMKVDLVAKNKGYESHAKKSKKGSAKPGKKVPFAKPKTTANSRADNGVAFYKSKGLKFSAG